MASEIDELRPDILGFDWSDPVLLEGGGRGTRVSRVTFSGGGATDGWLRGSVGTRTFEALWKLRLPGGGSACESRGILPQRSYGWSDYGVII